MMSLLAGSCADLNPWTSPLLIYCCFALARYKAAIAELYTLLALERLLITWLI
jgi:hypothetical protein